MSSLIQCFAACNMAGSVREKQKWILQCPPLMDILVKYVFELRRTCPNYWLKTVLTSYCDFKFIVGHEKSPGKLKI